MPKRTYQPKNKKRKRVHGFLKRGKSAGGRKILRNRRRKNKKEVSK